MYKEFILFETKILCIKDYASTSYTIKKGEYEEALYIRYESNNIDKVVTYSYVIKKNSHHIHKFSKFFINVSEHRKKVIKNILDI